MIFTKAGGIWYWDGCGDHYGNGGTTPAFEKMCKEHHKGNQVCCNFSCHRYRVRYGDMEARLIFKSGTILYLDQEE